ncbi:LVIVD repeat-containing protein [Halomicrococcus sp. NG-SE-24]|uniref:LVIVD repeat-containing protein n=1 Tax=Halomicrococcus sp. NG-SE-24 TaxID=3436928 RepID=UPI003D95B174
MRRREFLRTTVGSVGATAFASRGFARRPYEPLGRVAVENAKEAVVGPDGKTAYVAATDGFATVDVSDPANPSTLAERRGLLADRQHGPLEQIWDVKVEGDRLLVVGPANPIDHTGVHGFLLYDVGDPANPEQVAFHETDFPIHNAVLTDGVAYLTANDGDGNPLVMVDVSDDDPEEVGRWSMLDYDSDWSRVNAWIRSLHDLWVQDGVAYLAQWDAGTWVVDVEDPADPSHVAHFGDRPIEVLADIPADETNAAVVGRPGNHHYVMANNDTSLLGVGKEAWDADPSDEKGGPGGVELWDISNPKEARKLSTIAPPTSPDPTYDRGAAGVGVGGLGAGVAAGAAANLELDGLAAVDRGASNLGPAGVVAHRGCHDCTGGSSSSGVWTTAHNFDLVGDRLYSSWYQGGVKIHDVSDPTNPEELAWWRDPEATAFWTAKRAAGEFFVASSMGREADGRGGLYTFPDRAGRQSDPPSLVGNASGEPSAPQQSTLTEATANGDGTTDGTTAASTGQPGFGALAGLVGVGLGTWSRLRSEDG